MNPRDEQLNRLFRAAAQAPSTAPVSFGLETRAMAAWRESRRTPHGFWDMTLLVRGLMVAGVITAVSFWPALNTASNPFAEFVPVTDSTLMADSNP